MTVGEITERDSHAGGVAAGVLSQNGVAAIGQERTAVGELARDAQGTVGGEVERTGGELRWDEQQVAQVVEPAVRIAQERPGVVVVAVGSPGRRPAVAARKVVPVTVGDLGQCAVADRSVDSPVDRPWCGAALQARSLVFRVGV